MSAARRSRAIGGTFTLTREGRTSAPLAHNASQAEVAAALASLDPVDRKAEKRGRSASAGVFSVTVLCGEKMVVDAVFTSLNKARGRARRALEKHGDKVTSWFIYDETPAVPVRVAGCTEVGEEVGDE